MNIFHTILRISKRICKKIVKEFREMSLFGKLFKKSVNKEKSNNNLNYSQMVIK